MGDTMISLGPGVAVAIVLYALVGSCVAWIGHTGLHWQIPIASIRAAIQLIALALALGYVAHRPWLVLLFALAMSGTATWAAAQRACARPERLGGERRPRLKQALWCAVPTVLPAQLIVALLLVARIVHPNGVSVIPVMGIYLGNAMAIVGLTGRRAHDELRARIGEVEAALSIGLSRYQAQLMVCRESAATSLGPSLDQTRTIGLVTIPGAFVGMVLGGAAPWQAGVMQLFVSVGILAIGTVSLVATTHLVALGRV